MPPAAAAVTTVRRDTVTAGAFSEAVMSDAVGKNAVYAVGSSLIFFVSPPSHNHSM